MTFEEFNIHESLVEAISYMNYQKASPVQEQAIPKALKGSDILACAQTGTGKTATFVIPIINDLVLNPSDKTTTLIIVPTRELAVQIDQEIQGFSYFTNVSSKAVYGGDKGADWDLQKEAFKEGTNIIVATPGRLLQHISLNNYKFDNVRPLVLDEADRMLDMGFYDDIRQIIAVLPTKRQTMMFSATMPPRIKGLASKILSNPEFVSIAISKPAENVTQYVYLLTDEQKIGVLADVLEKHPEYESIIIFTSYKRIVFQIVRRLSKIPSIGDSVEGISSDFEQKEREAVLMRFKGKQIKVLVATDVLSRGIDIKGINLVVNYDVPGDAADYVHRVGRTARADAKGVAITLVNKKDFYKLKRIEKLIEREIERVPVPESLGKTPTAGDFESGESDRKSDNRQRSKNNRHRGGKSRSNSGSQSSPDKSSVQSSSESVNEGVNTESSDVQNTADGDSKSKNNRRRKYHHRRRKPANANGEGGAETKQVASENNNNPA